MINANGQGFDRPFETTTFTYPAAYRRLRP